MNSSRMIFEVLWVKLEQILQLEVGSLNFGSVQDSAINLTYPTMLFLGGDCM